MDSRLCGNDAQMLSVCKFLSPTMDFFLGRHYKLLAGLDITTGIFAD
jgi:hypothetical protein